MLIDNKGFLCTPSPPITAAPIQSPMERCSSSFSPFVLSILDGITRHPSHPPPPHPTRRSGRFGGWDGWEGWCISLEVRAERKKAALSQETPCSSGFLCDQSATRRLLRLSCVRGFGGGVLSSHFVPLICLNSAEGPNTVAHKAN